MKANNEISRGCGCGKPKPKPVVPPTPPSK